MTPPFSKRNLHCIATVRRRQRASLRSVARQMGLAVAQLRQEQIETADLLLSRVYAWQKALGVPVAELLVDTDDPLSLPVWRRATLEKMMESVMAISYHADNDAVQHLARALAGQLLELMPELKDVTPHWPVGCQPDAGGNCRHMADSELSDEWLFD